MAEIEAKKKHRKVLRTSFTKVGNRLYSLFKRSEPDFDAIETDWTCFELKYTELQVADNEIYSEMLVEATEENLLAEMEDCHGYKMRFTELHMLFKRLVNARNEVKVVDDSGNSVSSEEELKGKRRFKLPSIQFKRYDGNIKGWLPFWSQFKNIHDDSFIDKCDKIEYLIQATVEGSRARQLVTSFPMVADNYKKIIECMQARFGREDLQIEIYVRELLKLVLENSMATQKLELSLLYDSIETQLRALDTLGITSDKYAAILYPLIESCLPQDILRIWQRSSFCNTASSADRNLGSNLSLNSNMNKDTTLELKLVNLMSFLRSEVENEQKISLASDGFGLAQNFSNLNLKSDSEHVRKRNVKREPLFYTAAGLLNSTDVVKCLFCDGAHESTSCFKAQKMNLEEKKNCLSKHKACFFCLKGGHQARKCRTRLRCILCSKSHVPLMCPNLSTRKFPDLTDKQNVDNTPKDQTLSNFTHTHVFMQTVRVNLKGPNGTCVVRALIDSGSQRSYLLKSVASALGLEAKRREKIVHCLFGGTESNSTHFCYDVLASHGDYTYNMEVLDQSYICNEIPSAIYGPWTQELKSLNIELSDTEGSGPIELLLGLNVADIFYTGRRHILPSGLGAVETYFGWTIMGKSANISPVSQANMTCLSLFVNPSITELWELDVLGIQEPSEKKSKEQLALAAKELFLQTVIINQEGRYEVGLPWLEGHPSLPANFNVAKRRLHSVVSKLKRDNLFSRYNEVFQEWENLKIIEKTNSDSTTGHFLPHRPVLKEGSTTAVRPVFDASAREKNKPSLNQCLEKGPNLIESIPLLLLKFRKFEIGVVSDIKKAFLQISVNKNDSEFLKFLWLNDNGEEIVLRHKRVVFGVNCSPFLLGATIDYHLSKCLENCSLPNAKYSQETIERLAKSFYVDNCICSMTNRESLNTFIREAVSAMSDAQFDLRGWEFSGNSDSDNFYVMVLGLKWFTKGDVLKINSDSLEPDLSIF
ncbi:uncharacterized protein LOC114341344 [Diabrotica virgifera virgifera]|uniref:CCHC-type domain-containing protein n=1 Tax=Diabrotica virgifera virgifera TaxID=50390 RepID=A0ABM5L0W0_DIAVI|nr:uncharacterized protein LOC114341344 [Diabrotica virgifera virgifera]